MRQIPVLVTGGAGFIGSHTCKRLESAGYLPVTVDNLSQGHEDAVRWGPLYKVDTRDPTLLIQVMARHRIKTVLHLAAVTHVSDSIVDPATYYDNNVGGMLSLMAACRAAHVENFVLSSSCATYGIPARVPIAEDSLPCPITPFGRTKLICEEILADHLRAYGLKYVVLRHYNACGADPDGELSERHSPETHIIPRALLAASGRAPHFDLFGSDYTTPDGTCIRDFIHVSDLAEGHLMALQRLERGGERLEVNLGTGHGHSIREVLHAVERVSGRQVPVRERRRRDGDPPKLVANPDKAWKLLGFKAKRSSIDTIIRDAAPAFGLEVQHAQYA